MIKIINIASSKIKTSPFTYYKCIQCKAFGSNLKCPPYSPKWRDTNEIIKKYKFFTIICSFYPLKEDEVVSTFNRFGNINRTIAVLVRKYSVITKWEANKKMLELYKEIGGERIRFSSGRCLYCVRKGRNKQYCIKPKVSYASLESAGIDIVRTLKNCIKLLEISFGFMLKRIVNAYTGILHNDYSLQKYDFS